MALTGLTVAEYFRDEEGQDVLLFVDNIFRFTQVGPGWGRGAALHVPSGRGATWHVCWVPPYAGLPAEMILLVSIVFNRDRLVAWTPTLPPCSSTALVGRQHSYQNERRIRPTSSRPPLNTSRLSHRWLQANSEVSALLGRIPSAVGYQPTLATDLGQLQERITSTKKGSITSVQVRAGSGSAAGLARMLPCM